MESFKDKKSARSCFLAKRRALTPNDIDALSSKLCKNICASDKFQDADTVLLYSATRGEPDLSQIVKIAVEHGKCVAFPISLTETCTLEFRTICDVSELTFGAYGINEPKGSAPLAKITEKTLCIVPALAVDQNGFRLGYGKGYYDRFLKDFPGCSICAISSEHVVRSLPRDDNDIPVNDIITETGVIQKK